MDKATEQFDTSDTPKCPKCGYIVFNAHEDDDGEWYCMECSITYIDSEVCNTNA